MTCVVESFFAENRAWIDLFNVLADHLRDADCGEVKVTFNQVIPGEMIPVTIEHMHQFENQIPNLFQLDKFD